MNNELYKPSINQIVAAAVSTQKRIETRAFQHLAGICEGIAADGRVEESEVMFLRIWLNEYPEATNNWPGNLIKDRVEDILKDGIITVDERMDLLETLQTLSGNRFTDTGSAKPDAPVLPIDDDPSIFFRSMTFCFTGRFLYGTRAACERVILRLGGTAADNVSKRLDYLVIGSMIEPTWINTTYGRKIQSAMKHKQAGSEILIVSEHQWTDALADTMRETV